MIDVQDLKRRVAGPGKFEGEPIETLFYFEQMLDGDGEWVGRWVDPDDETDDEPMFSADLFEVNVEEGEAFNLEHGSYQVLWTDSQGFTMSRNFSTRAAVETWIDSYLGIPA